MTLFTLLITLSFILILFIWWHFYFFDDVQTEKIKFPIHKDSLPPHSQQKLIEKKLNEELQFIKIEMPDEAGIGINSEGIITAWNPQAETLFGWSSEKAIGKPFIELIVSSRYRSFYQEGFEQFLKTGESILFKRRTEIIALRNGGEEFPVELVLWKLTTGKSHHYTALIHDISDRKRLEKLKNDFIGTVSHELRTPLSILRGAISNLEDGVIGSLTDKQLKVIQTAHRNADRLSHLINDLLDLSRLESGRAKIHRARFKPIPLIQEVVHGFQLATKDRDLLFKAILPEELPDLYADPNLFVQILNNLLDNATRFAKKEIILEVTLEKVLSKENENPPSQPKFVKFSITNDGPSIPQEKLSKLFNKFEQLDRPSGGAGYKGTGLGLAICKAIINQHRGKIGVENKKSKGISFYFELPQYNDEISIRFNLDEMVHETERKKSIFSILTLSFINAEIVRKQLGVDCVEKTFQEIQTRIQNKILRKEDGFFPSPPHDFIFLLPGLRSEESDSLQTRILKELETIRCQKENLSVIPSFGLGIATYPIDGTNPEKLLAQAIGDANENQIKKVKI